MVSRKSFVTSAVIALFLGPASVAGTDALAGDFGGALPAILQDIQDVREAEGQAGVSADSAQKLDSGMLYDLVRHKIDSSNGAVDGHLVGILVPLGFFLCTVLVVGLALLYRSRKDRQVHQTLRAMVDKGADIPNEMLHPPVKKNADLRKGILLLAGGIGFSIFLLFIAIWEPEAVQGAGVGLVPAVLGLGYLLVWKLDKKLP